MASDADEIAGVLGARPGMTLVEVRDALRTRGRVSITVADVARLLGAHPRRFHADAEEPPRWWPGPVIVTMPRAAVADSSRGTVLPESFVRLSFAGSRSGSVNVSTEAGSAGLRGAGGEVTPAMPVLYRWQSEALQAWSEHGCRGVIEAVTGTGKTMIGVAATVAELSAGGQVCVLVPTRDLLDQWNTVLAAYLPGRYRVGLLGDGRRDGLGDCDVLIAIVNSARESDLRPRRPGGLLVADECHRYGSLGNRVALETAFAHRLGLSATYERADDGHLAWLDPYFGGTCYRMGYARAIDDGVTARFTVALVGVSFNVVERDEYDYLSIQMSTARAKLIRCGVPPEPIGVFLAAVASLARHGNGYEAAVAREYLVAMQGRRRLMAETPAKLDALRSFAGDINAATRSMVFTQTITGAVECADVLREAGVAVAAMHSGQTSKERRLLLRDFGSGTLQAVVAPQILDEGVDVPAADLAIIVASSRSRRQMVQRMGRILRRKPDGRLARFIVLYVEATVEDPATGAHEGFLEEITSVAESVTASSSVRSGASGLECDY